MAKNGTQFSESHFEKKLNNLKDTQESIQGLSAWCLSHKSDLSHMIKCWLKAIRKGKPEQCLTLFYLANDVIQHSKKKNLLDLVSAWEAALKEATPFAREEKVRSRVQRIFKIWEERDIYSTSFVQELSNLLEPSLNIEEKSSLKQHSDFETSHLVEQIHQCKILEEDTDLKQHTLNKSKVKITEIDTLRASVKERRKTDDFFNEFDTSVSRMEDYVRALEIETRERGTLIRLLEQADLFYEAQRGEFKVVCTAYKHFASRVKGVKRKLEEIKPSLPKTKGMSGGRSPKIEAPSPTSSTGSDLELPDAFVQQGENVGMHKNTQDGSASLTNMDLDSRITSFLAANSQGVSGSFLTNSSKADVLKQNPVIPNPTDTFSFYPAVNNSFANLTSLLAPPPPPPPPPLMPPPVFQDIPRPEPPSQPYISLPSQEPWSQNNSVHHSLPSRIPSWGTEESASNGTNSIINHHSTPLFPSQDVDLRSGKRPIDHRNLISLTSGPDKYSPPASDVHTNMEPQIGEEEISSWLKDVLKAQEARERKHTDINEQVNSLLDSFDHDQKKFSSTRDVTEQGAVAGATRITSLIDSKTFTGHHSRLPTSNASCVVADHSQTAAISETSSKVPSLMATVLYPDRHQYDQLSPRTRSNGSSNSTSSALSPSRGFNPARFSRPPYPRGSRW